MSGRNWVDSSALVRLPLSISALLCHLVLQLVMRQSLGEE